VPDASPGNKKAKDDCPWLGALARSYAALHDAGSTQSRHIDETSRDHDANLADRLWTALTLFGASSPGWRRAPGTGEGGSARSSRPDRCSC